MDMRNTLPIEAIRAAKDVSGLSVDEIAARTGLPVYVLKQYFRNQDGYMPALDKIPLLCRAFGNRILLQWLEAQVAAEEVSETPAATRADVLTAVALAGSALGDVQRIVAEAQVLYPSTAREIRSALGDVIAACRSAQAGLQTLAEQRDRGMVLASVMKTEDETLPPVAMERVCEECHKPWWKPWRKA